MQEQEQGNGTLITWILSLLGISESAENDRSLHYIAVDLFIAEDLNKYTYEEIKEAFKMYVKGTFGSAFDKIIYKLDCIILAKVMKCYDIEKVRLTRIYDEQVARKVRELEEEQNQLSDEEKEDIVFQGLETAYNNYKNGDGFNETGRLYLYDFLFDKNILPKDKATKDAVLKVAVKNIENKRKNAITKQEKAVYDIMTSNEKYSNVVLNECRRISIIRCFDKFAKYEQLLKKIKDV